MPRKIELAPCPVCGHEPVYHERSIRCPSSSYMVGSHVVHIYGRTKRETIKRWNDAFRKEPRR